MPACPHCGYELDEAVEECPLCSALIDAQGGGDGGIRVARVADTGSVPAEPGGPGDPAGTTAPGDRAGTPGGEGPVDWEDPAVPFPRNLWETWRESLFEPGAFFRRVPNRRELLRPVLYYLVVTVASAFFTLLWQAGFMAVDPNLAMMLGGVEDPAWSVVTFFLSPFFALAGLAVATLVFHLFVLLLAPDRRGIVHTARALAYSGGPSVLTVVPVVGPLVALVWIVVLEIVGIREAHRTTTGRAVLVVLLPVALAFTAFVVLVIFAVWAMAGASGPWTPAP